MDDIYIGYIKFVGCHGNQMTRVKTLMLQDVKFTGHTGSALQIISSTAVIVSCYFISNSDGSLQRRPVIFTEYDLEYLSPNEAVYAKAGAAMTLTNSSANI